MAMKEHVDYTIVDGFKIIRAGAEKPLLIMPADALRHWNEGTATFTPAAADAMLGILAERKRIRSSQ